MNDNQTPTIMIVGCGDLGSYIAQLATSQNYHVIGVTRSGVSTVPIHMIQADVTKQNSIDVIRDVNPDFLIYCVAASGQTDALYKAQYVDGLQHVLKTQEHNHKLKHVFFVSSTRMYGQSNVDLLDETITPEPKDFGGYRLLEAENLLHQFQCPATALRLTGIYGPGRLRMIRLAKTPELWPEKNTWTNRIHRDDAARFIIYLLKMKINQQQLLPCYIVTDSLPTLQYDVIHWLAKQLNVTFDNRTMPETHGRKLNNQLMLSTGFELQYPNFKSGYSTLIETLA